MTIWLVRHGESTLNAAGIRHRREDVELTTLGLKQALEISLPPLIDPGIWTSPLRRAYATACVIAAGHDLRAPQVVDALIERDEGESCAEAAAPVARLAAGADKHRDLVIVTHAGIIKGLLGTTVTPPNGAVIRWEP